ncbi:MAG: hypothetical protein DRQ47_09870, partial [Gammaproteobacteria bacterium]
VVTLAVIGLAMFGQTRVQNMPMLEPLAPAKDSTTALDVIIPKSKPITSNDLVERPMFWKERRPYVPPVTVNDKKIIVEEDLGPDPFEEITLMGIYSGGIMLKVDGEVQRIRIGGTIEGLDWSLDTIRDNDQAIFILGEDYKILELEHAILKTSKQARKIPNKKGRSAKRGKTTAEMMDEINKSAAKEKPTERKSRAELGKALK